MKKDSEEAYYSQIDLLMDQKIKNGLFEINEEDEIKSQHSIDKEAEIISSDELSFDDDSDN